MKSLVVSLGIFLSMSSGLSASVTDMAERRYQKGLKLIEAGRQSDALRELEAALRLDPEREDLRQALARVQGVEAVPPEAPSLDALTEGAPLNRVESSLVEAKAAYVRDDSDAAADAWRRALNLDASNAAAQGGLARLEAERYQFEKDQPFDSAVAELYHTALREARRGRYVEAKVKLDEALSLNPGQANVKSLLAALEDQSRQQSEVRAAEAALRDAAKALERGENLRCRALIEEARSLKAGALDLSRLERALRQASSGEVESLVLKAQKQKKAGQPLLALLSARRALALAPDNETARKLEKSLAARSQADEDEVRIKAQADLAFNQGVKAWSAGDLAAAAAGFRRALEIKPGDAEAAKALEKVRLRLDRQISDSQSEAQGLLAKGRELEAQGRLEQARQAYAKAAERDPSLFQAKTEAQRLTSEMAGSKD